MNLEKAEIEIKIKRLKMAKDEQEFQILKYKSNIERLEEQKKIQQQSIDKLENDLKEMEK